MEYTYGYHDEVKQIYSISITCSSSHGETMMKVGELDSELPLTVLTCPDYQHISHFNGSASDIINDLNIVCVNKSIPIGFHTGKQYVNGLEQNDQSTRKDGGPIPFDDEVYATQGRRRRPVITRFWFDKYKKLVSGMSVKYRDTPVEYKCNVTHIQMLEDDIILKEDSFEVIGFTSGSTCYFSDQQIRLDVQSTANKNDTKIKYATGTAVHYNVPGIAILVCWI